LGSTRIADNYSLDSAHLGEQKKTYDQRPLPSANQNVPRQEVHAMAAAQKRIE
jgi:hypothetical protein